MSPDPPLMLPRVPKAFAASAVNLNSLFIDEGFGTLDPDTLALVAETPPEPAFAQQVIVTKHQGFSTVEVSGLLKAA